MTYLSEDLPPIALNTIDVDAHASSRRNRSPELLDAAAVNVREVERAIVDQTTCADI